MPLPLPPFPPDPDPDEIPLQPTVARTHKTHRMIATIRMSRLVRNSVIFSPMYALVSPWSSDMPRQNFPKSGSHRGKRVNRFPKTELPAKNRTVRAGKRYLYYRAGTL